MNDVYIITGSREVITLDGNSLYSMIERARASYSNRSSLYCGESEPYRVKFMVGGVSRGYSAPSYIETFVYSSSFRGIGVQIRVSNTNNYTEFELVSRDAREFIYSIESLTRYAVYIISPRGTLEKGRDEDYRYVDSWRRGQSAGHSIAYECGDGRAIYEDSDKDEVNPVKKSTRRKARGNRTEEILIVSSDKEVSIKTLEI